MSNSMEHEYCGGCLEMPGFDCPLTQRNIPEESITCFETSGFDFQLTQRNILEENITLFRNVGIRWPIDAT